MATVGDDYEPVSQRLTSSASAEAHPQTRRTFTAQAFITTDLDDNQIIAFHPGAMN